MIRSSGSQHPAVLSAAQGLATLRTYLVLFISPNSPWHSVESHQGNLTCIRMLGRHGVTLWVTWGWIHILLNGIKNHLCNGQWTKVTWCWGKNLWLPRGWSLGRKSLHYDHVPGQVNIEITETYRSSPAYRPEGCLQIMRLLLF
jgi:hypothetical protein